MNNKYPLTSPQKLIYDMQKFAGGSIATICGSITIKGKKDTCSIKKAVNEMYRLNDAMRIRIVEVDGVPMQFAEDYAEKDIEILRFENKVEMDNYAQNYAKEPMDFSGSLCHIKAFILSDRFGIIAKMHHIISDAWTLTLVASQFYALVNRETPETYSYFDFLESDKTYLESPKYQNDKEYFITEFEKCEEVTYLSDKHTDSFAANRKTFIIPVDKTAQIAKYAEANSSSVFMLLMTVVGTYLNRVKMNTERLYIGTAMLNRFGYEQKNTMGMFVNTAPVLVEIENEKTFSENLAVTSKKAMQIMRHQKYNYGELLKELRTSHNFTEKLYDVMISYQNAKITGETGSFESTWYPCGMQTESLQIHIDDRDSEGILKIHYDYLTDKFTEADIDRIHNHIFNLLFDAINDDTKKPYELDILSKEEKQTLLHNFNNTKTDYPKDKCVHQLFEEQVLKIPDKTAVIACDKTLTYDELNRLSNRIANSLIEKGVNPNDIIAFALPRTSMLIATMFGILKSGAAYMPIDPDYPQDRIDYMLEDSNAKFFITEENIKDFVSDNEENPNVIMASNNYCYCIYTSGSTGKPKGTVLRHNGIINLCANLKIYKDLSNVKNIGFATTITFDVATQEIFTALINGFTGVLLPERKQTQIKDIVQALENNCVDVLFATPSYFDALTAEKSNAERVLKTLKIVSLAGEKFYLNATVQALASNYDVVFENQYGPAETHVATVANVLVYFHHKGLTINQLFVITEYERQKLLYSFNDTKADYPKDKCVHRLFEEQVKKTPDKIAVIACDKTLTYEDLDKLSNRIANSLIEKGVKANDIVAFALPRNSYLIAVMFGILKSGAAYMPIDPDYPQDRIDYMLSDSDASLFITEENINEFISENEETPSVEMVSNNYCYCIYTSGSTGKPKGTLVCHKGVVNLVTSLSVYKDYSVIKNVGFSTTITFDVASQEIFTALLNSRTGILMPERKSTNVVSVIDYIEKYGIDIIYATPSYFDMLTFEIENAERVLKVLKIVALAGEKFYLNAAVQEVKEKYDTVFENQYGPAEVSVITSSMTL